MSVSENSSSSTQAMLESIDATVACSNTDHIPSISESSESIKPDDASIEDLLSRPENFVVHPDFMESFYQPATFPNHDSSSGEALSPSHQQGAADQQDASQHPQSESQPGQYPVDHNPWTQMSEVQHPGYHVGQTSINQNTTNQTFNSQFAPAFVPSNNGLYQEAPLHSSSPFSFEGQFEDNNQLMVGPSVPSQNASDHSQSIANVSHYSLAHVMHHQNELASFQQQQPDVSEGMEFLHHGQSAFPHPQQQAAIPYQNQNWNNVPAFPPDISNHNAVFDSDQSDGDSVDSPAAPAAQNSQQVEETCGRSGRKPAGRKGRPRPTAYSAVEEAIIIEGMYEGISYAKIGEELGRLGQAVEHKVRRMKAQGKLH